MGMIGLGVNPTNAATSSQVCAVHVRLSGLLHQQCDMILAQGNARRSFGIVLRHLSSCCTRRSVILQVIPGMYAGQQWAMVSVSTESSLQLYPEYIRGVTIRGFAQGQALLDNLTTNGLLAHYLLCVVRAIPAC